MKNLKSKFLEINIKKASQIYQEPTKIEKVNNFLKNSLFFFDVSQQEVDFTEDGVGITVDCRIKKFYINYWFAFDEVTITKSDKKSLSFKKCDISEVEKILLSFFKEKH